MSGIAELDGLLSRLVDDQLDEAGTARLQEVLRGDAGARRRYRQVLALHAGLQWDYVAAARDAGPAPVASAGRWWVPYGVALAACLLVVVGVARWSTAGTPVLLTTASLGNGTLTWSDGASQRTLDAGLGIPPGRLVLEGDNAIAVLRFADDSTLTLSGDSELAVDDLGGRHLDLRRGILSAAVARQPQGQQLVVTTATARLEVLGTVFSVASGVESTTLAVEEGRVRLVRLADQQAAEVGAGEQASVSFDTSARIAVLPRPLVPDAWRVDFSQRPPAHWSGAWSAPTAEALGLFASMPYVAGRDAGGRPLIHHGVRVSAEQGASRPLVRLHAGSRLAMRFRMMRGDSRTPVKVMLCTMRDGGSFGGTFFATVDPQSCPADAAGWRTTMLAMPAFLPSRPHLHPSLLGHTVTFILANTAARPAGLEVASIGVDRP